MAAPHAPAHRVPPFRSWIRLVSKVSNNLLRWPAPLAAKSYGLMDFPRFAMPTWGAAPVPKGAELDPALRATNGYDFRDRVVGDVYVFLLGDNLGAW